jgi:hypothetical protein
LGSLPNSRRNHFESRELLYAGSRNTHHSIESDLSDVNSLLERTALDDIRNRLAVIEQERNNWKQRYKSLNEENARLKAEAHIHATKEANKDSEKRAKQSEAMSGATTSYQRDQVLRGLAEEIQILHLEIDNKQQEIAALKTENLKLTSHDSELLGPIEFVTYDQLRSIFNDLYQESNDFCLQYFIYPEPNNKRHQKMIQTRKIFNPVKDLGNDVFHFFVQSMVLRYSFDYPYYADAADLTKPTIKHLSDARASLANAVTSEIRLPEPGGN